LNALIRPLSKSDIAYKYILEYIENTKGQYNPKVEEIWELRRDQDEKRFNNSIGNNLLLWHGSRVTNFVGIIS